MANVENTTKNENMTQTDNITTAVREIDFATRFTRNWDALRAMMGIMRPIRKTPGTTLVAYEAAVSGGLSGGFGVGEGEEIPRTKMQVTPKAYADIEIGKYAKSVSIEAVSRYGAQVAVQRTDEAFLIAIQNKILADFYAFLLTGTLEVKETTWQRALAMAKAAVLDKFAAMDRDVTEVVGFANIMDAYDYMGDRDVTMQTAFGLSYIENFLGYRTLLLLPEKYIPRGKIVALPVENIDLYYIDPSDSDFAQLGLEFTVAGETNLIGVHVEGDYRRAAGDMTAIYGMKLWAEYIDGIAVASFPKEAAGGNESAGSGSSGE